MPRSFPAAQEPSGGETKPAVTISAEALKGFGINPDFVVSVHVSDGAQRIVIAEHRPGKDSALHVLDKSGGYRFLLAVPSPQLVDFFLDGEGREAFLVGSLGTRFYVADLEKRESRLILSSLPDKPGFRALTPVTIARSPRGPVVYGLFYKNEKESRDLGFARVNEDGSTANVLSTLAWEKKFGQVLSYIPQPEFKAALVIHQEASKLEPGKTKTKRLSYAKRGGEARELDGADDLYGGAWAPDGRSFVYVRRKGASTQLMMRLLSSENSIVLAEGQYFSPKILAGRRLVVSSLEGKTEQVLWTMELPAGTPQRLELPGKPAIYSSDAAGKTVAVWGPWGLSVFRFKS